MSAARLPGLRYRVMRLGPFAWCVTEGAHGGNPMGEILSTFVGQDALTLAVAERQRLVDQAVADDEEAALATEEAGS